jgi:hypothetical protein
MFAAISPSQINIRGFQPVQGKPILFWSLDFEWIKDVFCCMKQAGWMAKSKVVPDYKLEHTNKEMDGRPTSLLLLARFFSSALMLALLLRDRVHLPNILIHSFACFIAPCT